MHGKCSSIIHAGVGIFAGLPSPFTAMRYHSLIVESAEGGELEALAATPAGELMALRHQRSPTYGVQFHPESYYTDATAAQQLLTNFLALTAPVPEDAPNLALCPGTIR